MRILISKILLLFVLLPCFSQAEEMYMTYLYGEILNYTENTLQADHQLANGRYHDYIYQQAIGHPFFGENEFISGTLVYRNTEFSDQLIKYNIFDQSLVLKPTLDSLSREVILPGEYLGSFTLNGLSFKRLSYNGEAPAFYQVIAETEDLSCLYLWNKTREESSHMVNYLSYKFSNASARKYMVIHNEKTRYRNNRNFIKAFPDDVQKDIKNLIKAGKLNLKRISDQRMNLLIQQCQQLLNKENESNGSR